MSIEVTELLATPERWFDTWESADPRYQDSDIDLPSEFFLSPDRQTLLEGIFASFDEREDFYSHISSGLSGTVDGTYRVSLYMLAINESFASWVEDFSTDDLRVGSFVRAL
ncbi:hypothetical protein [Arthrobacter bambusae]|uniref:hypothetical protein n=1 Tax=Arthrobacter bambusae TaxID=1338426 RepID=UPI00278AACA5|nr:hypothetical protein [Arthrobacter bambusae]MDQ0029667.1 hypothetical protein [Arthrobacter bambusae]MDQ0097327.1 hypothetical protein [Arthrobacter bambusae]